MKSLLSIAHSQALPANGRKAAAFTVIEVLISLSILAMTAVVLGAAYLNVLTSYELAARDTQADQDQLFALSQLLSQPDLKKAEEGAEFDSVGNRHVRWKAAIEPTKLPDLFDVAFSCEIADPGKGGPRTETQTLRLLRPTWSEAADRDKLRQEIRRQIEQENIRRK
ncbi:MAG: prepilin-type N-terminal cleavage/methylation domain-containing protein [Opitutaceae bacterium]|jgi:general secretion pathway protein I